MEKIQTLNEMRHLEESGYGRPWPRHGLQLLHWFCTNYVTFNNNGHLKALEHPKKKKYGFHTFDNRDAHQLLPAQNWPYYGVGNLNGPRADDLPWSVRENAHADPTRGNMDRIIISLHPDLIVDMLYVTRHQDKSSFDRLCTFRISKGLVKTIRTQPLERLLRQVGYEPFDNLDTGMAMEIPDYSDTDYSDTDYSDNRLPVSYSDPVDHRMPPVSSAASHGLFLSLSPPASSGGLYFSQETSVPPPARQYSPPARQYSPPARQYSPPPARQYSQVAYRGTDEHKAKRCCCVVM